jgi:hypothetical protein
MVWIVGTDSSGDAIDGCSGELIGPTTVLTAAHCLNPAGGAANYVVSSARQNPGYVLPGQYQPSSPYETVSASAVVADPGWPNLNTVTAYDDVGIIPLSAPLPGASWLPLIQPGQVAPFETQAGFSGLAAGYGITTPNGQTAGNLYQTVISFAELDTFLPDPTDITGALFDYSNPGDTGTCPGDSGGPLLVPVGGGAPPVKTNPSPSNGDWAVVGVTHAGPSNECNDGSYTNVAYDGLGSSANDVAAWLTPYETPFDYTAPSVSGNPVVGNGPLTCQPGTWAEPTASFAYAWETVGTGGATPVNVGNGQTYTPQNTDAGSQLECAVTATVSDFGSTNSATSAPVSVTASPLSINTSQQPASVTVGGSIADQATVSGGDSPTGAVTFDLYSNSTASGTPLFTDTEPLSSATATSAGYTTTAVGTDYWVATYNGDANNNSITSGDAAEPVTVSPAPQTIKFISNPPANPVVGGSYTVMATGGASGNPVTLTIDSAMTTAGACSLPANATSGAKVSFTGAGTCTIDFNQAGNNNYFAVTQLQQSFTIDQAPMFVLDTPPLTAIVGQAYDYVFTASGVPTPAFALAAGAPSWLSVNATTGEVTGTPPKGTTSFTYTLTATNTVNVATAGPFTVKVAVASVKADISAVLSCPASLKTGTTSICTLTVANAGPAAANAVAAAVELPAGLSEVSCSTGCVAHRNVFTWSLASLAARASTKFTLTVKAVHAGSSLVLGAAASQSPDPNPFNNVSVQTITVTKA